ncbi:MAG TPA: alpha/beta hydrolase-fold protein [Puia sp.]|nr:alpha/beta hydrolase-fold protein [Puia sp.]
MKFSFFTCFFSLLFLFSHAQLNNVVTIGTVDSIHSQVLKEQRKFWVHLPPSAGSRQAKRKYPVVYLLDGDKNFTGVVGMIDLLSSVNGNSFFPEMIVIGILNTDRFRDLTPTHVTSGLWVDSAAGKRSGGGDAFMNFIEKELMPHIDSVYPAGHYRMIIGHSLGGLMVIHTLVHHRELFNSYVAIDPSMWWDKQRLLQETRQTLKTGSYAGRAIFLGMAHTQQPGMDTTILQGDTTDGTIHPRSILQLSRIIMASSQNELEKGFQYYDAETHASVPLMATYDALHFIFTDYQLILQDSYFDDPAFSLAAFLQHHYETISSKYKITAEDGSTILPPEDLVNNLGFYVLGKKEYKKAEDMFRMNIKNYPTGFVAYNYLGDIYTQKDDDADAIVCYKKSLSLKETDETRKKLEKLMRKLP